MEKNIGFIDKVNSLFNNNFEKAVSIVIRKNLGIRENESLLLVYDSKKQALAKKFEKVASKLVNTFESVKMPLLRVNGQEPSKKVALLLQRYDSAIIMTEKSLSHTKARRDATEKGTRIASMPGITEEILKRSVEIDYEALKKETQKLSNLLNKSKSVRITTLLGTDLTFRIDGRKAHGLSAGIYNKKGKWGNIPEGEVFVAPIEYTANGRFVVDGSIAGFGKIMHPVIVFVENGLAKKITDEKKPVKIEKLLDSFGKKARNIAEFGIGLNRKAKITGVVLEDEKVYGTCHIAFGNNIGFGGKVNVPLHIDCVIRKPNIFLDGKKIMKKGKLLISYPNIFK